MRSDRSGSRSPGRLKFALLIGLIALPSLLARAQAIEQKGVDSKLESHYGDSDRGGRWTRTAESLNAEQRKEIEELESIGYVRGDEEASEKPLISKYLPARSHPGLNLYSSGHGPDAYLMDMAGNVVHHWHHEFEKVWPDHWGEKLDQMEYFRRVHLFENGDLLAIFEGIGLIKIDKDSKLLWAQKNRAHHDLHVIPGGEIYVLTRKAHIVPRIDSEKPILEDFITVLDPEGNEKRSVSILEAFEAATIFGRPWSLAQDNRAGDVLHTNSIQVMPGRGQKVPSPFPPGSVLISVRTLDTVGVVDMRTKKLVWAQQGSFRGQHDARLLANGNILFYDNHGHALFSRVVELRPSTANVKWVYRGSSVNPFFSQFAGTAQRLPNGNTLITESTQGRAFEVNKRKKTVWEFNSPHRAGEDDEFVAWLFRVDRLPADFPIGWASAAPK